MSALLTQTFVDPITGTEGFLVIDQLVQNVAAGGIRMHPDVTLAETRALARNMTLKQAAVGIRVGGAKAGLALDPASPHRAAVLRRFLIALKPLLLAHYSAGPDMNTDLGELEAIGRAIGIPCLKIAVARNLGIDDREFLARYALFDARVSEHGTVNTFRGASTVIAAVREILARKAQGRRSGRIAIQGAGTMGAGTALLLQREGHAIVAWGDDQRTLQHRDGLDVARLVADRVRGRLPHDAAASGPRDVLFADCDVLVLAAVPHAITRGEEGRVRCHGIVEIANLGLDREVEATLHARGVLVVPDLLAGVGGSLAVEALYAAAPKVGQDILDHVVTRSARLAADVLDRALAEATPPRVIIERRVAETMQARHIDGEGVTA